RQSPAFDTANVVSAAWPRPHPPRSDFHWHRRRTAMRILLINVPHPSIGSRIPDDHLPPLGLLAVGGPLIDDGHHVSLLDGEFGPMSTPQLVGEAVRLMPDAVLFGHSGSTSGHPVIAEVARAIAAAIPGVRIVYGGVFPTYHWREILSEEPYVTAIVRGEGEETARRLMTAVASGGDLADVGGIAYRDAGRALATPPAGGTPRAHGHPRRPGADGTPTL